MKQTVSKLRNQLNEVFNKPGRPELHFISDLISAKTDERILQKIHCKYI